MDERTFQYVTFTAFIITAAGFIILYILYIVIFKEDKTSESRIFDLGTDILDSQTYQITEHYNYILFKGTNQDSSKTYNVTFNYTPSSPSIIHIFLDLGDPASHDSVSTNNDKLILNFGTNKLVTGVGYKTSLEMQHTGNSVSLTYFEGKWRSNITGPSSVS